MMLRLAVWILALSLLDLTASFAPRQLQTATTPHSVVKSRLLLAKIPNDDDDDFAGIPREELTGDNSKTDWDAEWQKVVQNRDQPVERPGKDYYKTEAEIAAIKTANRATKVVRRVASDRVSSVPSWDSLKGDWKVRACVVCVLCVL